GAWDYAFGGSSNFGTILGELYGTSGGYGDSGGGSGWSWISYISGGYSSSGFGNANLPSGYASYGANGVTVYHTYGSLLTSNSNGSDIRYCTWVDNIFQSCGGHNSIGSIANSSSSSNNSSGSLGGA